MAASSLDNAAPTVYQVTSERQMADLDFVDDVDDPIDSREVFGMENGVVCGVYIVRAIVDGGGLC